MNDFINKVRFLKIKKKKIITGAGKNTIEKIFPKITDINIKKEYLYHSYPGTAEEAGPFLISRNLVTIDEFSLFTNDTNYITDAEKEGWGWIWENRWKKKDGISWKKPFGDAADSTYAGHRELLPALMLSWNDASAYCLWLSEKTGLTVRLPREKEWELFAEETGVTGMEEFEERQADKFYNSNEFINRLCSEINRKSDLIHTGLLWEWTQDWFKAYAPGTDFKEYGEIYKVLRGGSLLSSEIQKTRQYRFRRCPTARSPFYGFRILVEKD
ncbi:MAG: SUMF1/EgtB/PvdO family nonheme iron enzyme [Spirochaetes bacterium]|nr:SUMF1/EgtB/PvdO family nonheme iron enzyme [Spirochaetota bacterium]